MTRTIKLNGKDCTSADVKKAFKKHIFKDTIAGPMPRYDVNAIAVERVTAILPSFNVYGTFRCYVGSQIGSASEVSETAKSHSSGMLRFFKF